MPSTTLSSVRVVLDSSTVMTPSLPTFSMAPEISSPICSSPADTLATWAMSLEVETDLEMALTSSAATSAAFRMDLRSTMGLAPAATFFMPSLMMAWARTTAVVVPSPATSLVLVETSLTSWAPMFSKGSSSSISLAMVTPSLVISGVPNFLSSTTLRPLGPRVILTVLARVLTPVSKLLLASSPYLICLAIMLSPPD